MKYFPDGLEALLATGSYSHADLYDFCLWDRLTHLRYTTADTDVLVPSNLVSAVGPNMFSSTDTHGSAYTFVQRIEAAALASVIPGFGIQIVFKNSGASPTHITQAFVGHSGGNDPYSFDGYQTQLTFNGGSLTGTVPAGGSLTSDVASCRYNIMAGGAFNSYPGGSHPGFGFLTPGAPSNNRRALLIAFNISDGSSNLAYETSAGSNYQLYINNTEANDANVVNKSANYTRLSGTNLGIEQVFVDKNPAGLYLSSAGAYFDNIESRATAHWKIGLDPDTWQVRVAVAPEDPVTGDPFPATIFGQPWLAAIRAGALRGATVDVHRAYWPITTQIPESPSNGYVAEDGITSYVAEDGATNYVQE